jgi:hypothetical protein
MALIPTMWILKLHHFLVLAIGLTLEVLKGS